MESQHFKEIKRNEDKDETTEHRREKQTVDKNKSVGVKRAKPADKEDEIIEIKKAKQNDDINETVEPKRAKKIDNQNKIKLFKDTDDKYENAGLKMAMPNEDEEGFFDLKMDRQVSDHKETDEVTCAIKENNDINETAELNRTKDSTDEDQTSKLEENKQNGGRKDLQDIGEIKKNNDKDEITEEVGDKQVEKDELQWDRNKMILIVGGTDEPLGYALKDIVPRGYTPNPRPPQAPAPPPPDLLDQHNPEFLC